jgi:hypothetical protein
MLTDAGFFLEGESMETVRKGSRAKKEKPRFGSQEMWFLYCHLEQMIVDMFPERKVVNKLTENKAEVIVERGVFYPNEVAVGYVSWLCKADRGIDQLLIAIRFRPQLGNVAIWLPVEAEVIENEFSGITAEKLSPKPYLLRQIRQVKSECLDQSYEGIGLAVGVMRRLLERGLYKLPEVTGDL